MNADKGSLIEQKSPELSLADCFGSVRNSIRSYSQHGDDSSALSRNARGPRPSQYG